MRNRDLAFGVAALAIAVAYFALTSTIPASQLADPIGPQGLPKTYAIVLALLSIALIVRSVRMPATNPQSPIPNPGNMRIAGMLLIGIAYILVLPYLGYLVSVALLITATIYFQGGAINSRALLIAVSGAALFWVLFIWILRIQYPASLWPSVL